MVPWWQLQQKLKDPLMTLEAYPHGYETGGVALGKRFAELRFRCEEEVVLRLRRALLEWGQRKCRKVERGRWMARARKLNGRAAGRKRPMYGRSDAREVIEDATLQMMDVFFSLSTQTML